MVDSGKPWNCLHRTELRCHIECGTQSETTFIFCDNFISHLFLLCCYFLLVVVIVFRFCATWRLTIFCTLILETKSQDSAQQKLTCGLRLYLYTTAVAEDRIVFRWTKGTVLPPWLLLFEQGQRSWLRL